MIHLASRSPRRRQLLEQLGVDFQVLDVEVPECREAGETPLAYVRRVARQKGEAGLSALSACAADWVLSADTEVVLDDEVFGKPADAEAAIGMLQRLGGRTHEVISVVWLHGRDRALNASCVTRVSMQAPGGDALAAYVATGESFGKAGGYAIQGRAAAFISRIEGSYSGVMGLPLHETFMLLREAGLVPL